MGMRNEMKDGEMPQRVQRKREKGWKMPLNTVYVGRPTKWGNPFRVGLVANALEAVELFAALPFSENRLAEIRRELRGKNLACWCPLDQPCHADVLLRLANSTD
jgi:hypothetical protein